MHDVVAITPRSSAILGRLRRTARGILLASIAIWPLAAIELVIEFLGCAPIQPQPLAVWTPNEDLQLEDSGSTFRASSLWLWEPRPGAEYAGDRINDAACRGPSLPREKGAALRIATFGDSSTFGMHVKEPECFSRRLEAKLRENGHAAEVMNFGCIGYSARQAFERWKGQAREWRPDVVVVAVGAVNEHWPSQLTDSEKLKVIASPVRRVREFLERYSTWRWLDATLAPQSRAAQTPSLARAPARVPLDEFESLLVEWARLATADGSKFLLVSPPRRSDAERFLPSVSPYTAAIERVATTLRIDWVDVYSAFRRAEVAETRRTMLASCSLYADSFHPSVVGHDLYAEILLGELLNRGWTDVAAMRKSELGG